MRRSFRLPAKPSQRSIRNHVAGYKALYAPDLHGVAPEMEQQPQRNGRTGPRGKQPESLVNKAVQQAARLVNGELRRNRQGMIDMPGGGKLPFGLGTGTLDLVGPVPVLITASMVGRTMAIYCETEQKTDTGRVEEHQMERIEHLRDMGAISGVCRNGEDFLALIEKYKTSGKQA